MSVPTWKRGENKLDLFIESQEFAIYILKICQNEKVFKPEYKLITDRLISDAMDIHKYLWAANNSRLEDNKRQEYQQRAISSCYSFLVDWNLSERAFHLRNKRVYFAATRVKTIIDATRKWMNNDANRRKSLDA